MQSRRIVTRRGPAAGRSCPPADPVRLQPSDTDLHGTGRALLLDRPPDSRPGSCRAPATVAQIEFLPSREVAARLNTRTDEPDRLYSASSPGRGPFVEAGQQD